MKFDRLIKTHDEDDLDVSSENDTIESKLHAEKQTLYPEKLGELIAGMYLSIQFKVIRSLLKKKIYVLPTSLEVLQVSYVTRSCGALGITLDLPVMKLANYDGCAAHVVGMDFGNFALRANRLCQIFRMFLLDGITELESAVEAQLHHGSQEEESEEEEESQKEEESQNEEESQDKEEMSRKAATKKVTNTSKIKRKKVQWKKVRNTKVKKK